MQWLSEECKQLLFTEVLLKEGNGQWEKVRRKSQQPCHVFIQQTQINTKHCNGKHEQIKAQSETIFLL